MFHAGHELLFYNFSDLTIKPEYYYPGVLLMLPLSPISFGSMAISYPLFLSPLAGYTNLPFRRVIREYWGSIGLCTTDLVNARSLIEKNRKALKLIETSAEDQPLAVQLFGSVVTEMVQAARYLESVGVTSIDINMGCPVKKVCQVGGGSAMMTQHERTADLVHQMVSAVSIPVTCKMRLGWDDANITAPELSAALEQAGAAAIFVHGRTRQQGFDGLVNLAGIRAVVRAVKKIPVIGNGDITTPETALEMLTATGCSGLSVGRGAFYNPWIFVHIKHYLETGSLLSEPTFEERCTVMIRHFELMVEVFGEEMGAVMYRKVGPWYAKRLGPASFFNKRIVHVTSTKVFLDLLSQYRQWRLQFLDEVGNLKPQYQPKPFSHNQRDVGPNNLTDDESDDDTALPLPAVTKRTALPVPSGPNELW